MSLQAIFAGPDDSETCDGCSGAVDGNPYSIDDAPEPGEFECMTKCRHILQIIGDDEEDDGTTYTWNGSAGFTENPVQGKYVYGDADLDSPEVTDLLDQYNAETPGYTPIETPGFEPLDVDDTPGYTPLDSTPGYTPLADEAAQAADSFPIDDNYLDADSEELFGAIPDMVSFETLAGEDADNLAQYLFDTGLDPTEVIMALSLSDEEAAELRVRYAALMGNAANLTKDLALSLLEVGNVEQLAALADQSQDFRTLLEQMGSDGFADSQAQYAYYLQQAIGGTVELDDSGQLWRIARDKDS